jgi:hypothetical protein
MPKKKKKDEAPLKKKQLLKLHVQELEESLRSATDERDGLAAKLATFAAGYQELEAKNKELVTRHSSHATAFKEIESKHSSLVTSSKETSEENELLILQLHQVQEELEHYFLENRKLSSRLLAASAGPNLFRIDSIHFGHAEDTAPHRHIDFTIEGARLGEKSLGSISLRLVEHHGRSGLVVFATPEGKHPMQSWREDGREDERTFLLIVPQDDTGRFYIQQANALDIILLRQSAVLLAAHMGQGTSVPSGLPVAYWRDVAMRFVAFLDENNDRLAAGDLEITAGATLDSFAFKISPALVGPNVFTEICGSWCNGSLILELLSAERPPLMTWPHGEDGKPVKSLAISFLRGNHVEQRQFFASLTEGDRRLLRLILETLPELVRKHKMRNDIDDAATKTITDSLLDNLRKAAHVLAKSRHGGSLSRLLGQS